MARYGDQQRKHVKEILGDHPILDAKVALRLFVTSKDVKAAKRKSPIGCVLAKNCSRVMGGVAAAIIYPTRAYVRITKDGGKVVIERFCVALDTQRAIRAFDQTGKFPLGEYVFTKPPKSLRIGAAVRRPASGQKHPGNWNHRPRKHYLNVRNGIGQLYAS